MSFRVMTREEVTFYLRLHMVCHAQLLFVCVDLLPDFSRAHIYPHDGGDGLSTPTGFTEIQVP